ncbi:hypothetical protein DPM19_09525 [Actinomadura craniellae]|uniref:Type IV secretion system protein n=1 Tax=Actinomadura craniellae TaxID=2231787 RepID=A0A365H7D0_9ACTN|nr:hypothetical protein [Actinomadura craniellae]RAY14981.1 hypothetical protein DPM19_09525 [Actinomadura craniellae]
MTALDPGCVQPREAGRPFGPPLPDLVGELGGDALEGVARAMQSAVSWFVSNTASWWVKTPSPDLEAEPAVGFLQHLTQPLTIAVAMTAMLVVAAKLALTRRANPLIDTGSGLAILAATTAIGVVVPNLLLQWGDAWCTWVLNASAQGDFARRMTQVVTFPTGAPAGVVLLLGIVAFLIGIVQAVLLLFRQGALIILAGLLPLAAAGTLTAATRPWFKKVAGWMLALVFYKPAAAAVYATAFTLIGTGKDIRAVLMGIAMMLISLIAFPVLLKFFTWTTGHADTGSGGSLLTAVMGGATALGALRSFGPAPGSGDSAGTHAGFLNQQLGPQGQDSGDQRPDGAAPQPGTHAPTSPPSPSKNSGTSAPEPGEQSAPHSNTPSGRGSPDGHGPFGGTPGASPSGAPPSGAPPGEGGEPVGPTTVHAADHERDRGPNMIRWMGNPTGSHDEGGPTGATDAGGDGGGT